MRAAGAVPRGGIAVRPRRRFPGRAERAGRLRAKGAPCLGAQLAAPADGSGQCAEPGGRGEILFFY